jgi:hypothetical protein
MRFVKSVVVALVASSIALPVAASDAWQQATPKRDPLYSIQPQTGERIAVPVDEPSIIEVVRPERTIVHDVDETLPLILSSTALLLVLASIGITLIRTRVAPRPGGKG